MLILYRNKQVAIFPGAPPDQNAFPLLIYAAEFNAKSQLLLGLVWP